MPFIPTDLSNLWAWYKTDAGVSVTGTDVDSWADQSGNSRNLTPGNPLYKATLVDSALNSLDVITANTNAILQTAGNFVTSNDLTVYIVGKQGPNEDDLATFLRAGTHVEIGRNQFLNSGDPVIGGHAGAGGVMEYAYKEATDDEWYTIRFRSDATKYYLSLNNGTEHEITRTPGTTAAGVLSLFYTTNNGGPNGGNSNKTIAEALVYTANLTGNNSDLVEYYLNQKYEHYTWTGEVPTEDEEEPINNVNMANTIPGKDVVLEVSTDSGTTWKSMICELSNTLSMNTEMSSTQTKCDGGTTISTPGAKSWEVSGEAVVDTEPSESQVSYSDALGWWSNATAVMIRIANPSPAGTNFYHVGSAYLTSLELTNNVGDAVQFSFSFTGNGALDIAA